MNLKEINIRKLKDIGISRRFYHNSVSFRTERDRYERENVVFYLGTARYIRPCIGSCFSWGTSKEGGDYWHEVYKKTSN